MLTKTNLVIPTVQNLGLVLYIITVLSTGYSSLHFLKINNFRYTYGYQHVSAGNRGFFFFF